MPIRTESRGRNFSLKNGLAVLLMKWNFKKLIMVLIRKIVEIYCNIIKEENQDCIIF